jgi:DNA ligase D-like protein (predicted polymerase)
MPEPSFLSALRSFCAELKRRGMKPPLRISLSPEDYAELEIQLMSEPQDGVAFGFVPADGRNHIEVDGVLVEQANALTVELSRAARQPANRNRARHWNGGEYIRDGAEPGHEGEHFYRCEDCGQIVDKRDLGQFSTMERQNTARCRLHWFPRAERPRGMASNVQRLLPDAVAPATDDLKAYWRKVHREALVHLARRPLTLVRKERGRVFFHTGGFQDIPEAVHALTIEKREGGRGTRLWVDTLEGLLGLVDLGVVELHPWQARVDDIEAADLMVFDLDPGEGIEWNFVTETALALRDFLQRHRLDSWPKTSGGKGLHLVVPLAQPVSPDDARKSAKLVAEAFARQDRRYTTRSSPSLRAGHIFIDYLRNGRGTTAAGAYSPRARPGFPLSMPVTWEDVEYGIAPEGFKLHQMLAGAGRRA